MKSTTEEDYEKYYWGRRLTDSISSRTQASSRYAWLSRLEIRLRPTWLDLVQLEMKLHSVYFAVKFDCEECNFIPMSTTWQASSLSRRRGLLGCLWVDIGSESVSRQSFSIRSAHFLPFCCIVLLIKKNHKITNLGGRICWEHQSWVEYIQMKNLSELLWN